MCDSYYIIICDMVIVPQTILTRTAEMAVLGFRVQDLTTELNKLKASQQTDAIMDNRTTKVSVICRP